RQPVRKEADDEFRGPARHERHDDLDRAVRIDLRRRGCGEARREAQRQNDFASRKELLAAHGAAASACSPPPCGEGLGVGVVVIVLRMSSSTLSIFNKTSLFQYRNTR